MDDKAIETYVLNIAEEFGIRNADTISKVHNWNKQFMQDILQRKIEKMRDEQRPHAQVSVHWQYKAAQIEGVEEVRAAIQSRK